MVSGSLLFILAEGLLFVLLNKYSGLGKVLSCVSSPLDSFQHVWFGGATKQEKMLGVVVPMHIKQDAKVQHTLSLWETACTRPCAGSRTCMVDLIIYVNCCKDTCGTISTLEYVNSEAFVQQSCFGRKEVLYACLNESDEGFPKGINNMFYEALYAGEDNGDAGSELWKTYDDIFWMEHDVIPIRSYWVDALQREADDSYMIKGSVYVGDAKHEEILENINVLWLVHINGNALYHLKSSCLQEILRRARRDKLNAFDVEIQNQLFSWVTEPNLDSYTLFQHCLHEYKYSDMIFNCVGGSCVHPYSAQTYFVHGNKFSTAGNYTR